MSCHHSESSSEDKPKHHYKSKVVYGEFIRTFTFSSPQLPIVQPGSNLIFPTATVPPMGVKYVEDAKEVGLLVPRGVYLVSWKLNPSPGASVNLLVNGVPPVTSGNPPFPYTDSVTTGLLDASYLIRAPLKKNNLISIVNGGTSLFTLQDIPNTHIGNTSILTQVRVQRLSKH